MPFNPGTPTTAAESAANWVTGSTAKAQKWVTKTLRPRVLFTTAAIQNAPEWLARIQQVGTAGYIAGMNRASWCASLFRVRYLLQGNSGNGFTVSARRCGSAGL
jgi:hypothetical protein